MQLNNIKVLVQEFRGKQFTDEDVVKFCEKAKIETTSAGNVSDYIYQQEYDERMAKVIPLVLGAVAKMNHIGQYVDELEAKTLAAENDDISTEIAKACEENGIEYREIGFLKELAQDITACLASAESALSNMGARVLSEMAKTHIADPLTVYALATKHREIANAKHEAMHGEPKNITEKPDPKPEPAAEEGEDEDDE